MFTIHTDLLFDPKLKQFVADISITVDPDTGLIADVYTRTDPLPETVQAPDIDLRGKVVMPGFVDAHTHIFLHPWEETPSAVQMRDESVVERVLRASNHCRAALLAGYTTYRDLGTESLGDADVGVRDAINRGVIPGPRLFVATECIASTASYKLHTENALGGVRLPRASDAADGPDAVRAAVRRRIGAGADVIKFYADYRRRALRFPAGVRFPPADEPNPPSVMFTQAEMDAIVDEAARAGAPVCAHCGTREGLLAAVRAGALTVEHALDADAAVFREMAARGTVLVATLAVMEQGAGGAARLPRLQANVRAAWELGVRLACGGDTGPVPHGRNAREMELHVLAGIPVEHVLAAATLGGWHSCGGDACGRRFGWFETGVAADVVALETDPRVDPLAMRNVVFVMKDARVWKRDGVPVGMV